MKNNKLKSIFYASAACLALLNTSCGEETPIDDDGPDPVVIDYLCEGNGDNSYWPLQEGNKWEFDAVGSEVSITVSGTEVFNGITYSKLLVNYLGPSTMFLRNDAAGNTYQYSVTYDVEHLIIAADPFTGQVIDDQPPGGDFNDRFVYLLGAPLFDVYPCDYAEILYTRETNNTTGDYIDGDEYVKGIGPVSYGAGGITFIIESVTLH